MKPRYNEDLLYFLQVVFHIQTIRFRRYGDLPLRMLIKSVSPLKSDEGIFLLAKLSSAIVV